MTQSRTLSPADTTSPTRAHPVRSGGALALAVAPLILLAGSAIHPAETSDGTEQLGIVADATGRWALAHALLCLGAIVLIFAAQALGRLAARTAPQAGPVAAATTVVGAACALGVFALEGFGALAISEVGGSPAYGRVLEQVVTTATPFAFGSLLVEVGLVTLGVCLLRGSLVPAWMAGALVLGALCLVAGLVAALMPVVAAGNLVLTVGMVALAVTGRVEAS